MLTQANAGQGAARNAGMDAATGEWVTFPDPDDVVDANYLETVDAFLAANPETHMVATNRWLWWEETGELENTHPLETFFRYDRLVDLADADGRFHGSAPAAFFRLDRLRELGIRYDDRIRPNFEDGHSARSTCSTTSGRSSASSSRPATTTASVPTRARPSARA